MISTLGTSGTWHLFTGEYPPACGGVADYTHRLASALATGGADVRVWTTTEAAVPHSSVRIHRVGQNWTLRALFRLDGALERQPGPRRILIEYVPSNFGGRSVNLIFALWVWWRSRVRRDRVGVMFHEFALPRTHGWTRARLAGSIHRAMAFLLIRASRNIWVSTPVNGERVTRRQLPGANPPRWTPIPSNLPVNPIAPDELRELRVASAGTSRFVVGHFGTFTGHTVGILNAILPRLLVEIPECTALLFGRQSREFAGRLLVDHPGLRERLRAFGQLPAERLSHYLQTCDIAFQPYMDGITSRRTTAMAALAHGLAVVTNSGPTTEPIWKEFGAVELLDISAEPAAYIAAISRLLRSPADRVRIAEAGRRLYDVKFDLRHTLRSLANAVAEGY